MNRRKGLILGVAALAVAGGVVWIALPKHHATPQFKPIDPRSPAAIAAEKERKTGEMLYGKGKWKEAKAFYTGYIERHAKDKDAEVQDEVGAARMHLGYVVSKTDGYDKARAVFQSAVKAYKGTGRMTALACLPRNPTSEGRSSSSSRRGREVRWSTARTSASCG